VLVEVAVDRDRRDLALTLVELRRGDPQSLDQFRRQAGREGLKQWSRSPTLGRGPPPIIPLASGRSGEGT